MTGSQAEKAVFNGFKDYLNKKGWEIYWDHESDVIRLITVEEACVDHMETIKQLGGFVFDGRNEFHVENVDTSSYAPAGELELVRIVIILHGWKHDEA